MILNKAVQLIPTIYASNLKSHTYNQQKGYFNAG